MRRESVARPVEEAASTIVTDSPAALAAEVARLLAAMTYEERVRAYRSGALTPHELALAAARHPEEMPLLNDELEWIAISLVDNE